MAPINSRGKLRYRDHGRLCAVLIAVLPGWGVATARPATAQTPQTAPLVEEDDPTEPVESFDLRYDFENDAAQNDKQTLTFRKNFRASLDSEWKLGLRADLPVVFSNAMTDANPSGRYQSGIGRPLVQAYLADLPDDRWAFAFGSKVTGPAASGTQFGSGNWDVVPGVALRYMLPEISQGSYFVPQVGYALTFAQSYPGRRTSNLQFSPQLKIALPEKWFTILFPSSDIRVNFGEKVAGQTGRLFFPLDAEAGLNITDALLASLEASAPIDKSYPVYRLKIEARLSFQF